MRAETNKKRCFLKTASLVATPIPPKATPFTNTNAWILWLPSFHLVRIGGGEKIPRQLDLDGNLLQKTCNDKLSTKKSVELPKKLKMLT